MNWHNAHEFFAMGGYGFYVWSAYAATASLMAIEAWLALRRRRRALQFALQLAQDGAAQTGNAEPRS